MIRQALAVTGKTEMPRAALADGAFEICAELDHARAATPTLLIALALKPVAADKTGMLVFHVTKSRRIANRGAISKRSRVAVHRDNSRRAAALDVIHQVVAHFARRIGQSAGKFRSRRVQKDARRFQR